MTSSLRWFNLAVCLTLYAKVFLDRHLVAVISPVIKEDLQLSDTELGWLKGFAFVLVFAVASIPLGSISDRWSRIRVISLSSLICGCSTFVAGFTHNFLQFAGSRFLFGIGAAGISPPSHALIANSFPRHQRARALAIYSLGIPLGMMLAFAVGGWLLFHLGWRETLWYSGVMGISLSVLSLLIHDQMREQVVLRPSLRQGLNELIHLPGYLTLIAAATMAALVHNGFSAWIMDFLYRNGLEVNDAGVWMGLIYGIAGCCGLLSGGWLADRSAHHSIYRYARIPQIALIIAAPLYAITLWSSNLPLQMTSFALAVFLTFFFQGPTFALVQSIAPASYKALSAAFLLFFINMFGSGLGPALVGFVSDHLAGIVNAKQQLQIAMSLLCLFLVLASLLFQRCAKTKG